MLKSENNLLESQSYEANPIFKVCFLVTRWKLLEKRKWIFFWYLALFKILKEKWDYRNPHVFNVGTIIAMKQKYVHRLQEFFKYQLKNVFREIKIFSR